jgi:hypothetical protein
MEERIRARVHARLGRQLDPSGGDGAVRLLDDVHLLGDVRKELRHLGAREVEELAHL